jgi:hypothetical protein
MVRCLTDFSCWETIAKLAPLGTALIVLIAAIIALGAMWVQMHIARIALSGWTLAARFEHWT